MGKGGGGRKEKKTLEGPFPLDFLSHKYLGFKVLQDRMEEHGLVGAVAPPPFHTYLLGAVAATGGSGSACSRDKGVVEVEVGASVSASVQCEGQCIVSCLEGWETLCRPCRFYILLSTNFTFHN